MAPLLYPCGDRVVRDDDALVIHAALPIADLEPSKFRAPILVFNEERFVLVSVAGTARRPIYRLHVEHEANLYAPQGKLVYYDGERHLDVRRDRARLALAWLLWIPTTPLLPLIGLLPERWKEKLVHVGVDPGRATRASLMIEWLVVALCLIAYPMTGGFFTLPGALIGALALFTGADIAFRVSADGDNRAPGAFGLAGALIRSIREGFAKDPPLLTDAELARHRMTREERDRERAAVLVAVPFADDAPVDAAAEADSAPPRVK